MATYLFSGIVLMNSSLLGITDQNQTIIFSSTMFGVCLFFCGMFFIKHKIKNMTSDVEINQDKYKELYLLVLLDQGIKNNIKMLINNHQAISISQYKALMARIS